MCQVSKVTKTHKIVSGIQNGTDWEKDGGIPKNKGLCALKINPE